MSPVKASLTTDEQALRVAQGKRLLQMLKKALEDGTIKPFASSTPHFEPLRVPTPETTQQEKI